MYPGSSIAKAGNVRPAFCISGLDSRVQFASLLA